MARRKKGQVPYESEHPDRPWMPDVPFHQQKGGHKGARVVVRPEQKEELEKQIERLREDKNAVSGGTENKG